jgi:hypothetical protein
MPAPYQILDLDLDPQNWTPIITPFGCSNVAVRNPLNVDLKIKADLSRTDQDIVPAFAQEGIIPPLSGAPFWRDTAESPYRFMPGSTVAYLQTTSGAGAVRISLRQGHPRPLGAARFLPINGPIGSST